MFSYLEQEQGATVAPSKTIRYCMGLRYLWTKRYT
jgi:hypothetical protein